jgi:hypothetical protein
MLMLSSLLYKLGIMNWGYIIREDTYCWGGHNAKENAPDAEQSESLDADAQQSENMSSADDPAGAEQMRLLFTVPNIVLLARKYSHKDITELIDIDMLVKLFLGWSWTEC